MRSMSVRVHGAAPQLLGDMVFRFMSDSASAHLDQLPLSISMEHDAAGWARPPCPR